MSDSFKSFFSSTDTSLMVMAAHRYSLGRQSYIVGSAIDWLLRYRQYFTKDTKYILVRDTVEALQDGLAGSKLVDEPQWENFARILYSEMSDDDQTRIYQEFQIRNSGEHPAKLFPL